VEETRYSFCHHGHVPSFGSFIEVLAKPSTLQRITVPLEDMHVIANPLLNKDRKECCKKTEDEGHEPENIDAYVRWRWVEFRERRRRSGRDGNLWGDRG